MRIVPIVRPQDVETLRPCVETLREAGHEVLPRVVFDFGDQRRFAREAAEAGADVVVACGGDGTINQVANGLIDAEDAAALPRLGIVPLGTANDLANGLGIPIGDPEAALMTVVRGAAWEVDVPEVNGRRCTRPIPP